MLLGYGVTDGIDDGASESMLGDGVGIKLGQGRGCGCTVGCGEGIGLGTISSQLKDMESHKRSITSG